VRISLVTLLGAALTVPVMANAQSAPYWQQKGYQRGHGDEARGARTGDYLRGKYLIRHARYRSELRSFPAP